MRVIAASLIERLGCLAVCAGLALLPALAQASEEDPWQGYNRFMFRINDNVDTYTLKPLAKGYQAVTPQLLEDGVHNIFRNIGDVGNLANNVLQGKLHDAGVDSGRLIFNTTFGLLGFFDVASQMGLQRSDEDFGQTLGAWGLGSGPYVVLPLLGPSTVRDAIGKIPDSMLTVQSTIDHVPTRNVVHAVNAVDMRVSLLSAEKLISGDKYIFIRNAYLQNREFRVRDGEVEDDF
ncbi:VacJ family lipoprotein [Pseudomonas sp.]|uniref:MlaA family lipoprotein n=1 Tax=Pseudomonas sp. TaxID=306 RepID=UPI002CA1DCB3|nr:VacJ family lipoprotein [Pseudomonas sp.]HUE92244.1 VacJ family lipoprotein [Pseudomonas sp.]